MSRFYKKKIVESESIGEKLRQAREKRFALSLESVSRQIKIDEKYLQLIEDNEWSLMPGEVYCRNFLKKYVELLQLDWGEFNKLYDQQVIKSLGLSTGDEGVVNMTLKKSYFLVLPRMLRNMVITIIALLVLAYVFQGVYKLIQPPKVDIIFPPDNFTTIKKSVKITGWTIPESEVRINDRVVVVDGKGYFVEDLDLADGMNVIEIEVKKRQGKVRVVERKIMVEDPENNKQ